MTWNGFLDNHSKDVFVLKIREKNILANEFDLISALAEQTGDT